LTKRRNHTVELANYTQQISTCDLAQRSFEMSYCQWHVSTTNSLTTYNACWRNMHLAFVGVNDTATDSTLQRSTQFVATKKIECYLKVLQEKDRAQAQQALQPCQDLKPDLSQFILMNRTAPDEKTTANLGNLTLKPGDEEWTVNYYGGLEATLSVTACSVPGTPIAAPTGGSSTGWRLSATATIARNWDVRDLQFWGRKSGQTEDVKLLPSDGCDIEESGHVSWKYAPINAFDGGNGLWAGTKQNGLFFIGLKCVDVWTLSKVMLQQRRARGASHISIEFENEDRSDWNSEAEVTVVPRDNLVELWHKKQ